MTAASKGSVQNRGLRDPYVEDNDQLDKLEWNMWIMYEQATVLFYIYTWVLRNSSAPEPDSYLAAIEVIIS